MWQQLCGKFVVEGGGSRLLALNFNIYYQMSGIEWTTPIKEALSQMPTEKRYLHYNQKHISWRA